MQRCRNMETCTHVGGAPALGSRKLDFGGKACVIVTDEASRETSTKHPSTLFGRGT